MRTVLANVLSVSLLFVSLPAQETAQAVPGPAGLGLDAGIPWLSDGQEFREQEQQPQRIKVDRIALVDSACKQAKEQGKLVLWYVHRIQEKTLQGRQMYRSPVLDVYMRQVIFADPDVAELVSNTFVPLRCVMDQALSDRFGLKPLQFVEPAVVFLDGDGKVVHFVERFRTFHGHWFAALCVRVLDHAGVKRTGNTVDELRQRGLWHEALALASKTPADAESLLQIARLQRLLRQPEQALDTVRKARALLEVRPDRQDGGEDIGEQTARRREYLANNMKRLSRLKAVSCEEGRVLTMLGRAIEAQPILESAWRGLGYAEAGYLHAVNSLRLGDEAEAMRRFALVAQRHFGTPFGCRAAANTMLGPDDRPLGAAFAGFEAIVYPPENAYVGLPKDTTWQGDRMSPAAIVRTGVEFLLQQQRDNGGFTDSRYAYWPDSEITPNVWVAITAIALTALWEHRAAHPDLHDRIDRALQRGEAFLLDEKHIARGKNEECYSDAYRLLYFARRTLGSDGELRDQLIAQMNEIVAAATKSQKASGFWSHEYENAFATGAVLQQVLAAKAAGATVPTEVTDKAAQALLSARFQNGAYVYGGSAGKETPTGLKDSAGRMPVCEGSLLQLGRSDLERVRKALQNFWDHMQNLETVRRNDFHSDGELAGFFFFHSLFHASEVVRLLPEEERAAHWTKFTALLQQIPEFDGSFLDSHELGRSYGTAMALLVLRNATGG